MGWNKNFRTCFERNDKMTFGNNNQPQRQIKHNLHTANQTKMKTWIANVLYRFVVVVVVVGHWRIVYFRVEGFFSFSVALPFAVAKKQTKTKHKIYSREYEYEQVSVWCGVVCAFVYKFFMRKIKLWFLW